MYIRLRNTGTKRNEFFETSEQFMVPTGIKGLDCETIVYPPEDEQAEYINDSSLYRRILMVGIPVTLLKTVSLCIKLGI